MNEIIRIILIVYGAVCAASVALYFPKLLGYRFAFRKPPYKRAAKERRISVIIPARDESRIIGDLFESIKKQTYRNFAVNVIVKDENDPTIRLAEEFGARVFVVPEQTCKGEALDGYFKRLKEKEIAEFDAFVIVDADAVLAEDYIGELNNALEHDYEIFITRKFAKNYLGDKHHRSIFSNCSALTWPMIDDLGNLYRMQKEIPLNLCGQGMMVRRSIIEKIGGWPYRSLTEDYELKLDSLLQGFRSMYYPYAVIYTEEALSHEENFHRRMRWIMGYSQCDRKYKKEIKEHARSRGRMTSGEKEYFFGVLPLLLYSAASIITIFIGAGLSIYYAVNRQFDWFYSSWYLVFMPFWIMYTLLFLYGVLAYLSDTEAFRVLKVHEKLSMLLFNPLYLLEYIPIYLKCHHDVRKGRAPAWRKTERMTYEEKKEE